MVILINEKPADITLDTEKTLADVLTGLELWIAPTKNRILAIAVDGEILKDDAFEEASLRSISGIKKLNVYVSSWQELAFEALESLLAACKQYIEASFEEREIIASDWEKTPAARFLSAEIADLYRTALQSFSGQGFPVPDLCILVEERLREISSPHQETLACEALVKSIAARMEELPLDMQTGKDQRAAETIQLFAQTGEKLFRIFTIFELEGLSLEDFTIDTSTARTFVEEFNTALKELSAAYENRDTVLVGDISEYELAPRLIKFFDALNNVSLMYSR